MGDQTELILINISGADKPGLTSALTEVLATHNALILDIGQADIHHHLSLGILFQTTDDKAGLIMKDLLFRANELNVTIRFKPVTIQEYNDWVNRQGKNRYIITLLGRTLTAREIADVTKIIAQQNLNIDAIQRLTGRPALDDDATKSKSCVEVVWTNEGY